MIFKYSQLRRFLLHCRQQAEVIPLRDWNGGAAIIMRHDVDFDLAPAFELAAIEQECGVRSSYFVMAGCPVYNPFSAKARVGLRRLVEWGFEIGLHFDLGMYDGYKPERLQKQVETEAGMISEACGDEVRSVSLHNPSGYGQIPLFGGFKNAYDPAIFGRDRYLSDSRMLFSGQDPFDFAIRAQKKPVQIVLHPEHYTPDGVTYPEIFRRISRRLVDDLDSCNRVNYVYVSQLPGSLFDHIISRGNDESAPVIRAPMGDEIEVTAGIESDSEGVI